ncbi:MAG: hypothetical protein OEZ43_15605 [Gammaproteobacteria bacterium]|nr:hypothetical protein [Gammaproteobacteria bacterium]
MRLSLLIVAVFSFTACTQAPLKLSKTPTQAEDFKLPPAELQSKFPDVDGLHPYKIRDYLISRNADVGFSRVYISPLREDAYAILGEPESTHAGGYDLHMTHSPTVLLGGYAMISWELPLMRYIAFGVMGLHALMSKRDEQLEWHKGDYRITAQSQVGSPYLNYWEWQHLPQGKDGPAVTLSSNEASLNYMLMNTSRPLFNMMRFEPNEHGYMSIGLGRRLGGDTNGLSYYLEASSSFVGTLNTPIDFSNQGIALLSRWSTSTKYDVGIGAWYDFSIFKLTDYGIPGKAGIFVEKSFFKTKQVEHFIRVGYAMHLDRNLDTRYPQFARVQVVSRLLK